MKITKIENEGRVYSITFKPNWVEALLGIKEKIKKYKDTGATYSFGGGNVYVDQKGRELGNTIGYGSEIREAIDRHRRSF